MSQLTEGFYVCEVVEWAIREAESGAVAVVLALVPKGKWERDYPNEDGSKGAYVGDDYPVAYGNWHVIDKQGQVNQSAMEQVVKAGCWLDDMLEWENPNAPIARTVVVSMKAETYQGKSQIRPAWLHAGNYKPGTGNITKRADKERLQVLQNQYGGQLRAAAAALRGS